MRGASVIVLVGALATITLAAIIMSLALQPPLLLTHTHTHAHVRRRMSSDHIISHLFLSFSFLACDLDFFRSNLSDMTRVLSIDKSSCEVSMQRACVGGNVDEHQQ